jgi:hypothetical protein
MAEPTRNELSEALEQLFAGLCARAAPDRLSRLFDELEAGRAPPSPEGERPH